MELVFKLGFHLPLCHIVTGADEIALLFMLNQVEIVAGTKRTPCRQYVYGLQKTGFPLRIIAYKNIQARCRFTIYLFYIPEVSDLQFIYFQIAPAPFLNYSSASAPKYTDNSPSRDFLSRPGLRRLKVL